MELFNGNCDSNGFTVIFSELSRKNMIIGCCHLVILNFCFHLISLLYINIKYILCLPQDCPRVKLISKTSISITAQIDIPKIADVIETILWYLIIQNSMAKVILFPSTQLKLATFFPSSSSSSQIVSIVLPISIHG